MPHTETSRSLGRFDLLVPAVDVDLFELDRLLSTVVHAELMFEEVEPAEPIADRPDRLEGPAGRVAVQLEAASELQLLLQLFGA